MTADVEDVTQTREYKKALKHHLKTKQAGSSADLTPFRAQEKKFKSKFPPPDLKDVLDPWALDRDLATNLVPLGKNWNRGGNELGVEVRPIALNTVSNRRGYTIDSHPGLVVIPAFLSPEEQRSLIRSSLENQARSPNETNLDTHYVVPEEGLWNSWLATRHLDPSSSDRIQPRAHVLQGSGFRPESAPTTKRALVDNAPGEVAVSSQGDLPIPTPSSSLLPLTAGDLLPKLRWANIGRSYHWGVKAYDFSKELAPFPVDVKDVCRRAVKAVPWEKVWHSTDVTDEEWGAEGPNWESWQNDYEPDAGIANFYQTKDTLMGHVDRSEVSSTTPLVSISLGNAAIFLIGGATRDIKPLPVLLRSGDVVIMSGPRCRRAFHGVPRILEGTLPCHLADSAGGIGWEPFASYMASTRVNINVRQVFPKGYVP